MARRGGGFLNRFKRGTDYGKLPSVVEGSEGAVLPTSQVSTDPIVEFRNPMRNNAYRVPGTVSRNKKNTSQTNPEAAKEKATNSTSRLVAIAKGYRNLNKLKGLARDSNRKPVLNARIGSTQGVSPPPVPNTLASATATALFPRLTPSNKSIQNSQNAFKAQGQSSKTTEVVEPAETPEGSEVVRTNTAPSANFAKEKEEYIKSQKLNENTATTIRKLSRNGFNRYKKAHGSVPNEFKVTGSEPQNVVTTRNNLRNPSFMNKLKSKVPSMPKFSMPSISRPNFLKKKDATYYIARIEELKTALKNTNRKTRILGGIYNNYVKLLNILTVDIGNPIKNTLGEYKYHLDEFIEFIQEYPIIDPKNVAAGGKIHDILEFFPKFYKPASNDLALYVALIHKYKNEPQINIPAIFKNYIKINSVFQRFETMMNNPKLASLKVYAPLMTALSTIYSAEFEDFKKKYPDVLTEQREVELEKEALDELPKRAKVDTIGVAAARAPAPAAKPVQAKPLQVQAKPALTMSQADMDAIMKAVKETAGKIQVQEQAQAQVQVQASASAQVSIPDKMELFFTLLKENNINYLNIFGSLFYLTKLYKNKNIQPALYNMDKFKEIFQVKEEDLCSVLKAFAPVFGIEKAGFRDQETKISKELKLGTSAEDDAIMIKHLGYYRVLLDERATTNAYTKTDNRANESRLAKVDGYIRFLETGMGNRVTAIPGLTCSEEDLKKGYMAKQEKGQGPAQAQGQAQAQGKSLTALETVALVQGLLQKQPKGDCSDCKEVVAIQRLLKTMISKGKTGANNVVDKYLKGDEKALETLLEILDRDNVRPAEKEVKDVEEAEKKVEERFSTIESSIQELATVAPEESAKIKEMESTIESIQKDVEGMKTAEPEVRQEDIDYLRQLIDNVDAENKKTLTAKITELESKPVPTVEDLNELKAELERMKGMNPFNQPTQYSTLTGLQTKIDELTAKATAAAETSKADIDGKIASFTEELKTFQKGQAADAVGNAEQDAIIAELNRQIEGLRDNIAALTATQQTSIVQSTGKYENIMEILVRNYAKKNAIPDLSTYALKSEIPNMSGYALKTDLDGLATKVGTEQFTSTIEELRQQIGELSANPLLKEGAVESIIDGKVDGRFTEINDKIRKINGEISGLQNLNQQFYDLNKTVENLKLELAGKTGELEKISRDMTKAISDASGKQKEQMDVLQSQLQGQIQKLETDKTAIQTNLGKLKTTTDSLAFRISPEGDVQKQIQGIAQQQAKQVTQEQLAKQLETLQAQLAAKQTEIGDLKALIDQKMRDCEACKESIEQRLKALKEELLTTQVPVEADIVEETSESEKNEETPSSTEELKTIKLISLKEHIDKFYQNISSPKLGVYDPDLIDLFIKKDQQVIKDYIDKIRDNGFHKIRKDGKILPTFKGAIDLVISNPSVYPAGVTEKLDRIIFGLFKIFVEYVTIVDEKNENRKLVGKDKRDSVFNALVAAIGEGNLRKIFHQNTIDEVKLKLVSNLEPYTYLTGPYKGETVPPPKILSRTTTDSETAIRPILSPLQLKSKRGGALNRTIDDVVFELLAQIESDPNMSEAAIDELLMEYGVDVDDESAVEKISNVLNFMRELYEV